MNDRFTNSLMPLKVEMYEHIKNHILEKVGLERFETLDDFDLCMLLDGYSEQEVVELRKLYF